MSTDDFPKHKNFLLSLIKLRIIRSFIRAIGRAVGGVASSASSIITIVGRERDWKEKKTKEKKRKTRETSFSSILCRLVLLLLLLTARVVVYKCLHCCSLRFHSFFGLGLLNPAHRKLSTVQTKQEERGRVKSVVRTRKRQDIKRIVFTTRKSPWQIHFPSVETQLVVGPTRHLVQVSASFEVIPYVSFFPLFNCFIYDDFHPGAKPTFNFGGSNTSSATPSTGKSMKQLTPTCFCG